MMMMMMMVARLCRSGGSLSSDVDGCGVSSVTGMLGITTCSVQTANWNSYGEINVLLEIESLWFGCNYVAAKISHLVFFMLMV